MALESGDIKKAINILKAVKNTSPMFTEAKKILAEVYLTHLKDNRNYIRCYQEIVENANSIENYKLYAEAMEKINEIEEAINAYENAL